jgi:hypothetical protein
MLLCHVLECCGGLASPGSQFASICAEFSEIFDWYTRIEDSIDVNEDAVRTAEEVARLFRERERGAEFGDDFADCSEVDGFSIE